MPSLKLNKNPEQLLEENKYLIVKIVNGICVNESNRQDLMQAGYCGLMRAYQTYNESFKTRFSTWAYWQIRWAVSKAQNDTYLTSCSPRTRPKRKEYYLPIESLDGCLSENENESPYESLCLKEEDEFQQKLILKIYGKLNHKLSPAERTVFIEYFVKSSKSSDIIKKFPTFYSTLSRISKKLAIIISKLGVQI